MNSPLEGIKILDFSIAMAAPLGGAMLADMGSGYSSDPVTKKFLEKHVKSPKHATLFRKTWSTWKKAHDDLGQKKLV